MARFKDLLHARGRKDNLQETNAPWADPTRDYYIVLFCDLAPTLVESSTVLLSIHAVTETGQLEHKRQYCPSLPTHLALFVRL